jgi:hypothetical protein
MQTCLGTSASGSAAVIPYQNTITRTNNLDLDIDLDETFTKRVDLDKARINSAIEATEARHQSNITLRDGLVWVRAADTAREGATGTNASTEGVN